MNWRDEYDKLNSQATRELKKLIGKMPNIEFNNENKTGFLFKTTKGSFWFECEVVEIKEEK